MSHLPHLIRVLKRQPVDVTPVWIMRQAGRYLPEYRAIRAKVGTFLGMCKNPQIAAEVTLQPLARFDLDAAIIFSDILTIPDALGLGLSFETHEGPQFARPIRSAACVDQLPAIDPNQDLHYVMEALRLVKPQLKSSQALMGFCGSPWTVATYMVEGKTSRQFTIIKKMMYESPEVLHHLLEKLAHMSADYLRAQIEAGCDAVMIFDTWGGILAPEYYQAFSLAYMKKIIDILRLNPSTAATPIILFTKQGGLWLEKIAKTGCDALGLDWTVDLHDARRRVGHQVILQGNLDPATLYAPDAVIRDAVKQALSAFGHGGGHIFNLGHGIHPDIQPEKVQVMVEAIREMSPIYHHKDVVHAE